MKIVLASNNSGKLREFQILLSGLHIDLVPQAVLGVSEIAETGLSFVENALLKARHACRVTGLPAIADDSGLVVSALQGAPGIYSARYAGPESNATKNIEKLLYDLQQVPADEREAFFYCVLVCLANENDPVPLICEGQWKGRILTAPQGSEGFGYDSVFGLLDQAISAAELPPDIKNKLSHRGQALRLLISRLRYGVSFR